MHAEAVIPQHPQNAAAETTEAADTADTAEETEVPSAGGSYTIGICQLVQHEALDAATQGFKDAIVEALGEDAVTFDEQNAQAIPIHAQPLLTASWLRMQI